MPEVEVAGGAGEAGGGADGLEAAGLVAGALEAGGVHEALDKEVGVSLVPYLTNRWCWVAPRMPRGKA